MMMYEEAEDKLSKIVQVQKRTILPTGKTDYVVSVCRVIVLPDDDERKVENMAEDIRNRLLAHFGGR